MNRIRSKEELIDFAKSAAARFVSKKIPLNDSVTKIAQSEGLVPDQIRFLAQEANKQSWASLFRENKDSAYDFPIADPDQVLGALQDDFSPKVVKDLDLDYLMAPMAKTAAVDEFQIWGVEKLASPTCRSKQEIKRDLSKKMEKLSELKNHLYMKHLENNTMAEGEMLKLATLLKNELLTHRYSDRKTEFKKFAEACMSMRPSETMVDRVNQIKERMEKLEVMEKTAALEAPENLINRNTGARIMNGNSEIIMRIKTLMEWDDAAHEAHSRISMCDETLPKVKEAIREL
jgi:hypothetical protein